VIGDADTVGTPPNVPIWFNGYAKGALLEMEISCKATGLGYIYDDFDTVDDWVMVHGQLLVSGGATSDVYGPVIGYAAGRHRTQLLTDNCRAKVTIQDGVMAYGESRVFVCADERMNSYYGMAISNDLLGQKVKIVRGKSSISVDDYETTTISITAGDEFEVWYDRRNSTVRVFQNGAEIASKYFTPTDIPHGAGCRYTGVVMSARWLLDQGPRFDDFTATDQTTPDPFIHDPIDSLTVNPKWVEVLNGLEVNRHLYFPPSLGPDNTLFTSAAAYWQDPMTTDSVLMVFTALRMVSGKFRVAVRSNTAMTNWVGFEFNGLTNQIRAVKGTGPNTVSYYGDTLTEWVSVNSQWSVTWDEGTETLSLYRGAQETPKLQWSAGAAFTGSGRYVGLSWTTDLLTTGIEPLSVDAYNIDADFPLPPSAIGGGS